MLNDDASGKDRPRWNASANSWSIFRGISPARSPVRKATSYTSDFGDGEMWPKRRSRIRLIISYVIVYLLGMFTTNLIWNHSNGDTKLDLKKPMEQEQPSAFTNEIHSNSQSFSSPPASPPPVTSPPVTSPPVTSPPPVAPAARQQQLSPGGRSWFVQKRGKADLEGQQFIKKMIQHAWKGYVQYAWGHDELKPVSRTAHDWMAVIPGKVGVAATIVDSLDTLYISGLTEEYDKARDFVLEMNLDVPATVSFFETTIRVLGGILSAHALTGDERYIAKAQDIGDRLLRAFDTSHGFPNAQIHLVTGYGHMQSWTGGRAILAEIASVQLEFYYLSYITKDQKYRDKAENVLKQMKGMTTSIPGMFPCFIDVGSSAQSNTEYSLGGLSDSAYEYFIKVWLQSDKKDDLSREMYNSAMAAIRSNMIGRSNDGHVYLGYRRGSFMDKRLEHLTCFVGGMFGLGAVSGSASNKAQSVHDLELAMNVTETCYQMYHSQKTGLSPESVNVDTFMPYDSGSRYYMQRPEVLESIFYMWRFTHDQKYRDWGMTIAKSIELNCRQPSGGYTGLHDVSSGTSYNDRQESFFLAETLKYLYLMFSDDDTVPLEDFVFNTEAHPLPVLKSA